MFSSIGWVEIFVVIIAGLIIIGPERLPGVILDVRAAIFAARKAINNAKAELSGEFDGEFDEFRKPITAVTEYAAMGPKRAIAKVLFDEEGEFLDQFDPRTALGDAPKTAMNSDMPESSVDAAKKADAQDGAAAASSAASASSAAAAGEPARSEENDMALMKTEYTPTQPMAKNPYRRRRHQPGLRTKVDPPANQTPASGGQGTTESGGSGGFSWADIT
ncbi:Sec-independent protein translocase TatB [Corynebacterium aquatimens]|uniref:Sec-independent protein translocase protein TatB n=1 Tax=Corynebacterium aquatimens TaxID=1190508 RepID=A0A931DZ10_9CORY|nr:sec-independent protein translocase protein TatB [Corynebacterium aquatimens]WJY66152.1 sec-independent translocase [Corynebacterium aquatimens]